MNIFDIIGPVMIGPSSSHTAGAARLGKIAREILGEDVKNAEIYLSGSFATTYKGHGTDKALVAGIMGMESSDEKLRNSFEIAEKAGVKYSFIQEEIANSHPNTVRLHLTGVNGGKIIIQGSSIGGGNVVITRINDMNVSFTGQFTTLLVLHHDKPGAIASVTNLLAQSTLNIGNFRLSRPQKGSDSIMTIEIDGQVENPIIRDLEALENIVKVILIHRI